MTYPAKESHFENLKDINQRMRELRSYCENRITDLNSTSPATVIKDIYITLKRHRAVFNAAKSLGAGFVQYVKDQNDDQALDVVAEFNLVLQEIDDTVNWITTNFPDNNGDGTGFLLAESWGADGPVDRTFNSGVTSGLRTELQTIVDAISVT